MSLSRIPSLDVRRVQHSRTSENARNAGNGHGTIGRNEDAKITEATKESRNRILRVSFVRGKVEQFPGRCAPMTKARYTGKWNVLKKVGKKRIFSVRIADRAAGSRNFTGTEILTVRKVGRRSSRRIFRKVYGAYTIDSKTKLRRFILHASRYFTYNFPPDLGFNRRVVSFRDIRKAIRVKKETGEKKNSVPFRCERKGRSIFVRAKYLLVVRPRKINRRDSFPGLTRE